MIGIMPFLLVYNYQRPLKSLKFKTPYERVIEEYQINPDIFLINPSHKKVGLNSYISHFAFGLKFNSSTMPKRNFSIPAHAIIAALSVHNFI